MLIHGPPGTGKTSTLIEIIRQLHKEGKRVLICANTHVATCNIARGLLVLKDDTLKDDDMCRIGLQDKIAPDVQCISLVTYLEQNTKLKEYQKAINQMSKQNKNSGAMCEMYRKTIKEFHELEHTLTREKLMKSKLIFATLAGAGNQALIDLIRADPTFTFDCAIIDECAQALEVSCWIPILKSKRLIIAGDHHQLPPVVSSYEARRPGKEITLFERDYNMNLPEHCIQMLKIQYRMNESIMSWSKEQYYKELEAHDSVKGISLKDSRTGSLFPPLILIPVKGPPEMPIRTSYMNIDEASLVLGMVKSLKKSLSELKESDIGIITPYSFQVKLIQQVLENSKLAIECSSVDGFQGREKEVIIISTVRSNTITDLNKSLGFLRDYRRMNVTITRARRCVILIGDVETLKRDEKLESPIKIFEQSHSTHIQAPSVDCDGLADQVSQVKEFAKQLEFDSSEEIEDDSE